MGWEISGRTRARLLGSAVAALIAAFLLLPTAASAHTDLVSSNPEEGAVLEVAPDHIVLEFVEPVGFDDESVEVLDPDGKDRAIGTLGSNNGRLMSVVVDPGGKSGSWQVGYRVRGVDGHLVAGRLDFSVGEPSGGVAGLDLSPLSAGALIVLVAAGAYLLVAPRLVRDLEGVR